MNNIKNWLPIKNLQFLIYFNETWSNGPPQWLVSLTTFRDDSSKIVDFLLVVNFWSCPGFFGSVSTILTLSWSPPRLSSKMLIIHLGTWQIMKMRTIEIDILVSLTSLFFSSFSPCSFWFLRTANSDDILFLSFLMIA